MKSRLKLGALLVQAGVLDANKLTAALAEQQRWGGRLGRIIVRMGFLSDEALVQALSKQLSIEISELRSLDVPAGIRNQIDMDFARANSLCPERLSSDGKSIVVAMSDPVNVMAIDEIMHRTGLRVHSTLATERAIEAAINLVYGEDLGTASEPTASNVFLNNQGVTHDELIPLKALESAASGQVVTGPVDESLKVAQILSGAQLQQQKALRVLVDMLVEKSVFTREEFTSRVDKA